MGPFQAELFPAPPRQPPPAPPPARPGPPPYVPDVEGARHREQRVREALRQGPATLAQLVRRTGLGNATLTALLPLMADDGLVAVEPVYSLPPAEGR
jgi:hypothetical protein